MPKVKVNPNAQAPAFEAVQPGDYRMKFERHPNVDKRCNQSEKGNWMTTMVLKHVAPAAGLISLSSGQPLKATELPASVFIRFMMDPEMQGTLRQALESCGLQWPAEDNLEIDEEWIQRCLENRECVVRLKTREYQGNWNNDVQRFITQG